MSVVARHVPGRAVVLVRRIKQHEVIAVAYFRRQRASIRNDRRPYLWPHVHINSVPMILIEPHSPIAGGKVYDLQPTLPIIRYGFANVGRMGCMGC